MEISVGRGRQFSWPVMGEAPTQRRFPLSHRSLRVLVVLALYGATVMVIHRLAAESPSHASAAASATGMCHRD